jgi:hypothetical protein
MSPEQELLLAILRQTIRDYIKLDPDSDLKSAEFSEQGESFDYKTAEDFLYNGSHIYFGSLVFNYKDMCNFLGIDAAKLKRHLASSAREY